MATVCIDGNASMANPIGRERYRRCLIWGCSPPRWREDVTREDLSKLIDSIPQIPNDIKFIEGVAPFIEREYLDRLVNSIDAPLSCEFIEHIAPFVGREALEKMLEKIEDKWVSARFIKDIAPFISSDAIDKLIYKLQKKL